MLNILPPSDITMEYITEACLEGDRFLLRDLKAGCPSGYTVSIDCRERISTSYCWFIQVRAPPCFFGDFLEVWEDVQRTGKVPVLGKVEKTFATLLKMCLEEDRVPDGALAAGFVYFISCSDSIKHPRTSRRTDDYNRTDDGISLIRV